ncbi:MAG: hypothetical protein ACOZHQ_09480 [Thermodesulfobacteriota bacterium]
MSLSAAFLEWANTTGLRRAVAIEITLARLSDGQELTIGLTDSAPRRGTWGDRNWERCILKPPRVEIRAQELAAGSSLVNYGDLEIAMDSASRLGPDGDLTWRDLKRDYRWVGGAVMARVGGPDLAWADWAVIPLGWLGRPSFERGKAHLRLLGFAAGVAKKKAPGATYSESDGVPEATVGKVKPCCMGSCLNVTPVLIGEDPWVYQVHAYGPVQAITVRVGDLAASPTIDLANGKFSFASKPSGQVTADVEGWVRGGVYLETAAQMIESVLLEWGGAVGGQIDSAAFAAAATAAPQVLGVYWTSALSVQQALDGLVQGLPLFWGDDAQGRYTLTPFGEPSGDPVLELYDGTAGDPPWGAAAAWSVRTDPSRRWYSKVTVYGDRNYTPNSRPDETLSADRQEWLKSDYRSREATGSAPADNPEVDEAEIKTAMADLDDCAAAAAREIAMHGVERQTVTCECLYAAMALKKGDVVRVWSEELADGAGWLGIVMSVEMNLPSQARVTLWG